MEKLSDRSATTTAAKMIRSTFLAVALAAGANAITINFDHTFSAWGSYTKDPRFGEFYNDGGSGGKINGINLLALSDSIRPGSPFPLHTAFAYLDPDNPNSCHVIGNYSNNPPTFYTGNNGGVINYIPGVDPPEYKAEGFAPAPRVTPIPIPGNTTGALCVYPIHRGSSGPYGYNTMFELNVLSRARLESMNSNVPAERIKPILFNVTAGQAGYGSKALTSGDSTYFYAWEGDRTGIKLARVPWATRRNTASWDYWNGQAFVRNAPLQYGQAQGNVFDLTNFGDFALGFDVKYVDHFGTYIMTYNNAGALGSDLYASYSTSGKITGPYTQPVSIAKPIYDTADCEAKGSKGPTEYGVQANWDYYGTNSKTLLVSWVSCASFVSYGNVTFNN